MVWAQRESENFSCTGKQSGSPQGSPDQLMRGHWPLAAGVQSPHRTAPHCTGTGTAPALHRTAPHGKPLRRWMSCRRS